MLTELVSRHKIVHTLYVDFRQCFHLIVFKTSVTAVFPSGQCINVARKLDKADVTDHTTNSSFMVEHEYTGLQIDDLKLLGCD